VDQLQWVSGAAPSFKKFTGRKQKVKLKLENLQK
jgi:hypothetical protein